MTEEVRRRCYKCLEIFNRPEIGEIKRCDDDECKAIIVIGRGIFNPIPDDLSHTREMNYKGRTEKGEVVYDSSWKK